jgi:ATP-dependent Lon protease
MNYKALQAGLDREVFDLADAKRELLTHLAVRETGGAAGGRIPCLVGPAGVGKKTLVCALARALDRKLLILPVDGHGLVGKTPVYGKSKIGEVVGRLIHLLNQNRGQDLVVLVDGMESISPAFQREVPMGFMEVLSMSHDYAMQLKHIDAPLDFSRIVFFAAASDIAFVHQELLAGLELVPITGYGDEQKIAIAKGWIIPREAADCGLAGRVDISGSAVFAIIRRYTNELGLVHLSRLIRRLLRRLVLEAGQAGPIMVEESDLPHLLGAPQFDFTRARTVGGVGMISTLGRSGGHGVLADLEVALVPDDNPSVILTGNMDGLFREVVMVAITCIRQRTGALNLPPDFYRRYTIHCNGMPAGVLKSGVSAGLAVFLALYSALASQPIAPDVSALGEITLSGQVRGVAGVHEKALAAYRLGIKTVLFPAENQPEVASLPPEVRRDLALVAVSTVEQAAGLLPKLCIEANGPTNGPTNGQPDGQPRKDF